jgi:uncharacterized membrane protein YozB (DUF420 family)
MTSIANSRRPRWLLPTGLILLSTVPVTVGLALVATLAVGTRITPDNARFFASPVPVVVHIIGVSLYCLLGAFQFVPGFRRRRPGWHRVAGRVLVPAGLAAALAGLWMTLFYPLAAGDVELLRSIRLVFGWAVVASLVLGFTAIRRRDIAGHRAWMIRGYAIAQGAGTQVLVSVPWLVLTGKSAEGLSRITPRRLAGPARTPAEVAG